jgi:hypothetical protein
VTGVWDGRLKKAEITTQFGKVSETWRAACVAPAMRVTPNLEQSRSGSLKGAVALTRAIEKSSPASALHQQPPHAHQAEEKNPPRIQVELVSQAGTEAFDPNWDGPRLLPTFVAQVMGQAMNQCMPERRTSMVLETAYGTARLGRMALLLDRKS